MFFEGVWLSTGDKRRCGELFKGKIATPHSCNKGGDSANDVIEVKYVEFLLAKRTVFALRPSSEEVNQCRQPSY